MSMLEFSTTFSLGESLLPFVSSLIPETKENGSPVFPDERAQAALKLLQARVVGREKDGAVIVAWSGIADGEECGDSGNKPVTLMGLIEGRNPLALLYSHDKLINVVSASVDQGRSLLSFTEVYSTSGAAGNSSLDELEQQSIYQSFVVELQPAGRVLSLDVRRPFYQRTQFVYNGGSRSAASKDVYMLFILHHQSIGMYHFKLNQINDVLVLAGQPVACELWSQPVWFQWSQAHQRLYFVYDKPQLEGDGDESYLDDDMGEEEGEDGVFHPVLRVVEFFDSGAHEVVLELRLPFEMRKAETTLYSDQLTWCESVPDRNCNMAVLQLSGDQRVGSLCVVYQHVVKKADRESRFPSPLKYTVCILHHAYRMELSMPTIPALDEYKLPPMMLFTVLGDYIMVWIPGKVLHLLDCSTEHGAFHHMLLQDSVRTLPYNSTSVCSWPCAVSQPSTGSLFDTKRQDAFTVSIQRQELAELFAETSQESLRAASLHYALVHQRDNGLARKMIEHLCRDPAAPDCTSLLAEYLLAASYAHMRREGLDSTLMQLLPISMAGPFRSHVEEGRDGSQLVRIFYSRMHGLKDQVIGWQPDASQQPLAQVVVPSQNKLLLGLQRNLVLHDGPARFNLRAIKQKLESAPPSVTSTDSFQSLPTTPQQPESRGFFRRLSSSLSGRRPSTAPPQRSGSIAATSSLPFLETQPEEELLADHRRHLVVEHFRHHLKKNSHESLERCQQIAQEYAATQMHHSKYLLNAIWTSLRHPTLGQPSQALLRDRGRSRDKALFTMAEHFSAAVRSCGFPTPSGFNQFFAALGLRCLDPLVFLQYAQQNVFFLTNDFVRRVVHELNNTPENAELKFQVRSRCWVLLLAALIMRWLASTC